MHFVCGIYFGIFSCGSISDSGQRKYKLRLNHAACFFSEQPGILMLLIMPDSLRTILYGESEVSNFV